MKVYIALSCPRKFKIGAKAISWWMNKPYSHILLIFEYADSKPAVFHAAHGMVHFKSLPNFLKENTILKEYEIELTEQEHLEFFDDCMELAGEKYGYIELVKILTSDIIYDLLKKDIKWKNSKGYICSELVGKFCIEKLKIDFNKPTFLLKPSDVDDALGLNKYKVSYEYK